MTTLILIVDRVECGSLRILFVSVNRSYLIYMKKKIVQAYSFVNGGRARKLFKKGSLVERCAESMRFRRELRSVDAFGN